MKSTRTSRALIAAGFAARFALLAAWAFSPVAPAQAHSTGDIGGCRIFPADNVWNVPVDMLPVDANSAAYVAAIGGSRYLHADFGSGAWNGGPIGIPFIDVPGDQPKVAITFYYPDESDPGPYPIPPDLPIEGGPDSDGDRHVLVMDRNNCILYEVYNAHPNPDGSWDAGSGAIFDLKSHALRPAGWTSADAAGLPILPGLVTYDEVASGEIRHAIRFTAPQTRRAYVWPARHYASSLTGSQYPPMGQRFRLRTDYNLSGFSPEAQVILRALKKYGMILADNGSSWYISGAPDERWDNDALHALGQVPGSAFEAVDESALMLDPDSGQVNPDPPTSTTVDDTAAAITYAGSWNTKPNAGAYGGSYHSANKKSASLSFSFSGTQFTWIAARGPKYGKARVIVDGAAWGTLDFYHPTTQWQYRQTIGGLAAGAHTVQIKVLGAHSASSGGNIVVFDGYSVP